jgi:hypothetical protein
MIEPVKHYSGGCQCGAIRFRIEGPLGRASICHCRMCQKAFGNFFAPLISIHEAAISWTKGEPKRFRSSSHVARGFCGDCGTPLTYEAPDGLAIAIGAFDRPAEIVPELQYGVEAKLPYVACLNQLPHSATSDDVAALPWLGDIVSYQHPDHDTEPWPPA